MFEGGAPLLVVGGGKGVGLHSGQPECQALHCLFQ